MQSLGLEYLNINLRMIVLLQPRFPHWIMLYFESTKVLLECPEPTREPVLARLMAIDDKHVTNKIKR